jgi:trigger factor
MKVTIEPVSSVQKKLSFEIPPDRVGEEIEKAYRTFQQSARIKGFRAGKVPRPLLERQFGEQVAAEVGSRLVEESYAQALAEHPLSVVAQPQIVTEKLIPGQPFRYSATVEVRPDITVPNYEGLEVEKHVVHVGAAEIENALQRLAESLAQLHPVTERDVVEPGDVVRLDYSAFLNGKPIAGLQGKGRLVEVGQESIFPGFTERLLGMRRGAMREFSLAFPRSGDSSVDPPRLATFRVTAHEVATKEVPPLDDEFAKDHGECATVAELRARIGRNLQQAADQRAESRMEDALITQLINRNPFEIPPSLVREQEYRLLLDAGVLRPGEDLAARQAALPEQLRSEFQSRARHQIRAVLLLDALVKQLGLSVTEEEVKRHLEGMIAASGVERQQQIEAFYAKEENRQALERRLVHEKALRVLVDKALIKVVEQSGEGDETRGVAGETEKD